MKPKFQFFEVVKVSPKFFDQEIAGQQGVILGMAEIKEHQWKYSVHIDSVEESWYISEKDLSSTGQIISADSVYDGSRVKVLVDPNTLEGSIV